ncbi:MAG: hypothetical protein HWE07_09855 [Cytophagia bacterium]|nr:hypothetical protein [Cytophagia bacterium]
MARSKFLERMQEKWELKSAFQTVMVLIVFAFTGSTVLFIKPLVFDLVGFHNVHGVLGILLYIVLIFPLYQILILIYGFLFGQFAFFWNWEKQFLKRMGRLFGGRKKS